jgi:HNH endonuclease
MKIERLRGNGYCYTPGKPEEYEHIGAAERALGRKLPVGSQVHHVDGNKLNNLNVNLVICPNQKYHRLLHCRESVIRAGGDPNTQKICCGCREVLPKTEFSTRPSYWDGYSGECRNCTNARRRGCGYGKGRVRSKLSV